MNEPIKMVILFGIDQKDIISKLLDNLKFQYRISEPEAKREGVDLTDFVGFEITFERIYDVYLFGYNQAVMFQNMFKI